MRIITEDNATDDVGRLRAAWEAPETFAFVTAQTAQQMDLEARVGAVLPDDLRSGHFVLMTSGSTGEPTAVIGSRARAERLAEAIHVAQGNEAAGSTVLALPLSYSFAFVNQWLWSTRMDRPLHPSPGLADIDGFVRAIEAAERPMICMVGIQGALLADALGGRRFEHVAGLHFAGGRFPQAAVPRLREVFPNATITNNFGCAQAMPRLTVRRAEAADDAADVGRPLPGIELRTASDGRLLFRSAYGAVALVAGGELQRIGDEDWIETGDHAEPGEDGSWRIVGRTGEVFKRHGEKVSIPQVLESVSSIWEHDAAGYADTDRNGEAGWVLVLAPVPEAAQVRAVLRVLRERHRRAMWPLRIEGARDLPRLGNGKIDGGSLARVAGASEILWDQRT